MGCDVRVASPLHGEREGEGLLSGNRCVESTLTSVLSLVRGERRKRQADYNVVEGMLKPSR